MLQIGILAFLFAFAYSQCNETDAEMQALCNISCELSPYECLDERADTPEKYFDCILSIFSFHSFEIQEGKVTKLFARYLSACHSYTVEETCQTKSQSVPKRNIESDQFAEP